MVQDRALNALLTPISLARFRIGILLALLVSAHSLQAQAPADAWFSLEVGDSWTYEDEQGTVTIRVAEDVVIGDLPTLKVSWFMGQNEAAYQTEFWRKTGTEYLVVGRALGTRQMIFEQPYPFLKEGIKPGDTWEATLSAMGREMVLTFTVADEEVVNTDLGEFSALKVTVNGPGQIVERWYAPAIGMVKEKTRVSLGGRTSPGNKKVLIERTEGK